MIYPPDAEVESAFYRRRALHPATLGTDDARLARTFYVMGWLDGARWLLKVTAEWGQVSTLLRRLADLLDQAHDPQAEQTPPVEPATFA